MVILYEYTSETKLNQQKDNNNPNHRNEDNDTELNASKSKKSEITTLVLCPSYKISRSKDGHVECDASFHLNACNTTVDIYLEVWIKEDRMLQSPSREIFIDCDPDAEVLNRYQ